MLGKIKWDLQQTLFKARLTDLINLSHTLVKLAEEVSWDKMELEFQNLYSVQGKPNPVDFPSVIKPNAKYI